MFGWWDQVDQLWVTEITEHPTREGKVYCAVVLDARQPAPGTAIHSDHGVQGGFNRSSQHLVVGGGAWVWVSGRSRFVSTGGRSRRRDGRRSPGGRIGSGSGRRSLTA